MTHLSPTHGGCWFCHQDEPPCLHFSLEWDSYFHWKCLLEALATADLTGEYNDEAESIAREFSHKFNPPRPSRSCSYSCHHCGCFGRLFCHIKEFFCGYPPYENG